MSFGERKTAEAKKNSQTAEELPAEKRGNHRNRQKNRSRNRKSTCRKRGKSPVKLRSASGKTKLHRRKFCRRANKSVFNTKKRFKYRQELQNNCAGTCCGTKQPKNGTKPHETSAESSAGAPASNRARESLHLLLQKTKSRIHRVSFERTKTASAKIKTKRKTRNRRNRKTHPAYQQKEEIRKTAGTCYTAKQTTAKTKHTAGQNTNKLLQNYSTRQHTATCKPAQVFYFTRCPAALLPTALTLTP